MAENKKSFIAYVDWSETFKMLSDEDAGKLVKHLFSYVNDEHPVIDNPMLNMAFLPMRLALKRDLEKYKLVKEKKAEAGRKGGLKSGEVRKQTEANEAHASDAKQTEANEPVSDSGSVTGSESVTGTGNSKSKEELFKERKLKFASTLEVFKDEYPREMLKAFNAYWTEPNTSGTKFRRELEKTWDLKRRLETWAKNDKNFNHGKQKPKDPGDDTDFQTNR